MKVEGPKGPSKIQKSKKSSKSSKAEGDFSSFLTNSAGEAEQTAAAQNISKVDVLLAAQASEDPTERAARQRMQQRGNDILDSLENIKMALINGNLRMSHIENITHMVAQNREKIDDPGLMHILDEIDLRAQVELAKLEAARDAALEQMQTA